MRQGRPVAPRLIAFMLTAAVAAAMVTAVGAGVDTRVIAPPGVRLVGPYSPGILAGDFLYVSGQGGRGADGTLPDTIEGQVRQTLLNLQAIVEAGGMTLQHVVYSQVYLTDMAQYDAMDRVWREFFPTAPPARAVLGVYRLPTDIAVEINAVAYRDLASRRPIRARGRAASVSGISDGEAGASSAAPSKAEATPGGVMAGNRLFLSGALGADEATGRIPQDPDAQLQLALDNMRATLAAAGLDFRHVVFVNPYLTAGASRQMNAIYARHFEYGNTPARATINVTGLPGGSTIQFTGVAIADLSLRCAFKPKNMRPSATASPCVLADDTYYCSAKGPFTPGPIDGPNGLQGIWVGTVEAQVRQTMRNLLDGLEEAGLGLPDVVATNVYLDDMDDFARMNRVYAQYFPSRPPARTTIAQVAPADRTPRNEDTFPTLEQISLIAVK